MTVTALLAHPPCTAQTVAQTTDNTDTTASDASHTREQTGT